MTTDRQGLSPINAIRVSVALARARDELILAANELSKHKGVGTNNRRRKADELRKTARMIQFWIETGEPEGYA